ncbi:cupin [Malaciobacter pacificus]|uniref:Cupin domain-containing protein n=1 Tax=Malaciobacter pacificus TaxID=1080223 RepID=A0A5C2H479_9BACT|nr:cupin [Malaciobacter pacificus]QEP33797.1 Cupin domain-containing protein [Malaciobacter pacificus]GGD33420.1 cupin [Malaciobacter pacificus]
MISNNILNDLNYNEKKPSISVLFESSFSKEIRILLKENQIMSEHKTPYPIVVEVFDGCVDFGVEGKIYNLIKGDILTLEGNVPHDLKATSDCIIRLSLSKLDSVNRVKGVLKL